MGNDSNGITLQQVNTTVAATTRTFDLTLATDPMAVRINGSTVTVNGNTTITSAGNIEVGDGDTNLAERAFDVNNNANLTLKATDSIVDPGSEGDFIDMIGGGDLRLIAGTGIGAAGAAAIDTRGLSDVAATTNTVGIFLANSISGTVNITTVTTVGLSTTVSGDIEVTNNAGGITLSQAVSAAGSGNVSIIALAGSIVDDADDTTADVIGNNVVLTASTGVGEADASGGASLDTTAVTLDVSVTAAGLINIDETDGVTLLDVHTNNGSITIDAGGLITANAPINSAGGPVSLLANNGVMLSGAAADVTTSGGTFTVDADSDANGSGAYSQNNAGSAVLTSGGNVSITAADVALTGTLAGTGTLTLQPSTTGRTIGIGGGTGDFNLDDTDLTKFTNGFSSITIGKSDAGDVEIDTATLNDPLTIITGGEIHNGIGMAAGDTVTLDGTVAPGQSPVILTVIGNFAFADNSSYEVEIGGTSPGDTVNDHDQIDVTGTVSIGNNITLDESSFGGFSPNSGNSFVIINNDLTDLVSGTFAARPEGYTFINFLSSGVDATLTYIGGDGNDVVIEVELDYGDAPDPMFPILLASNGARHIVGSLFLGSAVDVDVNGFGDGVDDNGNATDDDTEGATPDDEDGVVFTSAIAVGATATIEVTTSTPGVLNAWIDFTDDGDWVDSDEQMFTDAALVAGLNSISFSVPSSAVVSASTFARFRFDSGGGLSYD